ncbi:MAG: peptidylprolyl isomerase [Desulfobacterales bacterium]|nr:MAG: peptidylprolyl isomerase [Desulfobacterales bacterium]
MAQAKIGDTVKINFTGKLEDETIVDSSQDQSPLEFTIGNGDVISGLEQGVIGMAVGDKKTLKILPEDAFGQRHEELLVEINKSEFPEHINPTIGLHLQIQQSDGQIFKVKVVEMTEDTLTLDGNHPLAGTTLHFDVEMVEIV